MQATELVGPTASSSTGSPGAQGGQLCLWLLRPPFLPSTHSPSLPLSQGKLCLETSQAVIRSGQRKALSNPGSQPRGPSNGFTETKERKIACSPGCQEGWPPGGRMGFTSHLGGQGGGLARRTGSCHISVITASWLSRKNLGSCPSCLCQGHVQAPGQKNPLN